MCDTRHTRLRTRPNTIAFVARGARILERLIEGNFRLSQRDLNTKGFHNRVGHFERLVLSLLCRAPDWI